MIDGINSKSVRTTAVAILGVLALSACGGGGGSTARADPSAPVSEAPAPSPTPAPTPMPDPPTDPEPAQPPQRELFETRVSTSRFLSTATFGARSADIDFLSGGSASEWFLNQIETPTSFIEPIASNYYAQLGEDNFLPFSPNTMAFWQISVNAPDQLRWRMVYALSQILVASDFGGEVLSDFPTAIGYYIDVLAEHALGNYRELLEAVTYSPAMGHYLTYMGNLPADDATGRMPDENYAREILQLFSIGLLELNLDGSPRLDSNGRPIETYTNSDITGLARVFTGLNLREGGAAGGDEDEQETEFGRQLAQPMFLYENDHSSREKRFLGTTISAGTSGTDSVRLALDHIMAHPNVGPFIGRQLIQRFTTSNPTPEYITEVARAFNSGRYVLPDNNAVGDGRKGDLSATIAAVLFSVHAQASFSSTDLSFGKPREPVLRLTQWARAFGVNADAPEYNLALYDTLENEALSQHPFRSRSVFNFYRPGYIAPGTETGAEGMTVPELQIVNASSIPGYMNFMSYFVFGGGSDEEDLEELREVFNEFGLPLNEAALETSYAPIYDREFSLAETPTALVSHLDLILAAGALSTETETAIVNLIGGISLESDDEEEREEALYLRVALAILMTMTAPEYLVQR